MMDYPFVLLLVLTCIIIGQQFFWSRQNQKLVDKLMSRNYHEYQTTQRLLSPAPQTGMFKVVEEPPEDMHGHLGDFGP